MSIYIHDCNDPNIAHLFRIAFFPFRQPLGAPLEGGKTKNRPSVVARWVNVQPVNGLGYTLSS